MRGQEGFIPRVTLHLHKLVTIGHCGMSVNDFITEVQLKGTQINPQANILYCFRFYRNKNILVTQHSMKAGNETGGVHIFCWCAVMKCFKREQT